jgi:hypothetical protein
MFLKTFGIQGKALGTPRRALSRGQVSPVRIARYLYAIASPVTPDPVDPTPAATAEFLTSGGREGITFTSVDGNGDNFKVVVFKEVTFIPPFTTYTDYYIYIWNARGNSVYTGTGSTLAASVTNAQNAAALTGVLEITLASGVTEVVYSGSQFIGSATPVD